MTHPLVNRYALISDQVDKAELSVILRELESVLTANIHGDIVEFGCYIGTTSVFIQRLLAIQASTRSLHVYDSFAGLPVKTTKDISPTGEQFTAGELVATKHQFISTFHRARLPLPVIHKAWFADLTASDIPRQIAFAFLDGDFYNSIYRSLELVWPALALGAVVIVDDYQSTSLPGARRAVDEWLKYHNARLKSEASLAIIHHIDGLR